MARRAAHNFMAIAALFASGVLRVAGVAAPSADEQALWTVWQRHQQDPTNHTAVVALVAQFEKQHPQSPLAVVVRGLGAWHDLAAGQTARAAKTFEQMLAAKGDPLLDAGQEMGRHWLTRLDRERVRVSLRKHYAEYVEFPPALESLKRLPADAQPPYADRWGRSWIYRVTALPRLKTSAGQDYILQSAAIGETTDLAKALKLPYAAAIALKPVRAMPGAAFQFEAGTERPLLAVGTQQGGITFAFLGKALIVLSNGDHWQVLQQP